MRSASPLALPLDAPIDDLEHSSAFLRALPAWLISLLLHLTTLTLLGIWFQKVQHGVSYEPGRTIGIALASRSGERVDYFSDDGAAGGGLSATVAINPSAASNPLEALPAEQDLGSGAGLRLPTSSAIGALPGEDAGTGVTATILPGGGGKGKGRTGTGIGKDTQTGVFGVQGVGSRFVYVFDRSSSMLGYSGRPLASAKRELIASLSRLENVHQFQIIFYNDRPTLFNPYRSDQAGMFFADDKGKRLADDFVRGIPAEGSTQHMDALRLALRLKPDVIFFLTDGDEPQLKPTELAEIRRTNHGAAINAIEFGAGAARGGDNFLKRLARENDGQYGYLDVTQLPEAR